MARLVDFGSGVLGDIACHELSPVFKALKLADRHPDWIEACSSNRQCPPEVARESAPLSSITRWHFPAQWDKPALTITWWGGGLKPPQPEELEPEREFAESDWLMIVGDKGKMLRHEFIPDSKAKEVGKPPRVLARSPGHYGDYHASYMSIHWWPREELSENRETVAKINRRLGYRLQLRKMAGRSKPYSAQPFVVEMVWADAGVAPCYGGGFPTITLKDEKGGIVSVNVDESSDVRRLKVASPGLAPVERVRSLFTVAHRHHDPAGDHAPPTRPGTYGLFVSIGSRDGTPQIALPLPDEDRHHRYKVGQIRLLPAKG